MDPAPAASRSLSGFGGLAAWASRRSPRPAPAAGAAQGLGQGGVHRPARARAAAHLGHSQRQVRAGEAAHQLGGGRRAADRGARGSRRAPPAWRWRCRRAPGRGGELGEHAADLHVLGAEVVSPLADAVGLVDRPPGDSRGLAQQGSGSRRSRAARAPRRRAVSAPGPWPTCAGAALGLEGRGQVGGRHAALLEGGRPGRA